ncbi:biotin synthase BioB [Deinococcus cellulosilyticus]|uniref:Biotin synthase n=1 Tax=Deinococcus cellulosilyticus (strain DSM 18568 / NBRC 106333 / KACC 11606 / 5516J-15) TaxID=1223518 RepID=A0A511MY76_DEIC1|nr:biotin synthase BioB [Deinococcus cellulosilyticus]GEM45087.1 biotin synthase [Deinococcus cellulosilyticus NBRC 106333 = KACC 11606]
MSQDLQRVLDLFQMPFLDLVHQAHQVHRQHFRAGEIQASTLLSIKTGGCPEDCAYCPQSAHYDTGVKSQKLLDIDAVLDAARHAKSQGASRFCMGAAWRSPKGKDLEQVAEMVREVKALGLETCATLGLLDDQQAHTLGEAGLDYYNHNLDTSSDHYGEIITTRTYQDRLNTLHHVREAGMKVCCGGILGLGENREQRARFLLELSLLNPAPESVPINHLIATPGTPLEGSRALDWSEVVRTVAVARILMPTSFVRLSAGREGMGEPVQAWCFMAGANSIFLGEKLLTAPNPDLHQDHLMLEKLNLTLV